MFLRKVSQKSNRSARMRQKSVYCVTKYYCSSLYSSSYRQESKIKVSTSIKYVQWYYTLKSFAIITVLLFQEYAMFPLLFYLILRWRHISKLCNKLMCSNYLPDSFFHYDVQVVCKSDKPRITPEDNVKYIIIPDSKKIYQKDSECQTDKEEVSEKSVKSSETSKTCNHLKDVSVDGRIEPIANSTLVVENVIQVVDENDHNTSTQPYHTFVTAADFTPDDTTSCFENKIRKLSFSPERSNSELQFFSFVTSDKQEDWQDILDKTKETVKKVDEYIYDDYETFKNEDFNQIALNLKSTENSKHISHDFSSVINVPIFAGMLQPWIS